MHHSGGDVEAIGCVLKELVDASRLAAEHVELLREERGLLTLALQQPSADATTAGLRDALRSQAPILAEAEAESAAASEAEEKARRALRWEEQAVARQQRSQRQRVPQPQPDMGAVVGANRDPQPVELSGTTTQQVGSPENVAQSPRGGSAGRAQARTVSPAAASAWADGSEADQARACREEREMVEVERVRLQARHENILKFAKGLTAERQKQRQEGHHHVVSVEERLSPHPRETVEDLILRENLRLIESKISKLNQAQAIHVGQQRIFVDFARSCIALARSTVVLVNTSGIACVIV